MSTLSIIFMVIETVSIIMVRLCYLGLIESHIERRNKCETDFDLETRIQIGFFILGGYVSTGCFIAIFGFGLVTVQTYPHLKSPMVFFSGIVLVVVASVAAYDWIKQKIEKAVLEQF